MNEVAPIARSKLLTSDEGFSLNELESTADILIPDDPMKRVIGQDEAVKLARVAAKQRRHFLLVGPPGTGKSMIAQALSLHLPPPSRRRFGSSTTRRTRSGRSSRSAAGTRSWRRRAAWRAPRAT